MTATHTHTHHQTPDDLVREHLPLVSHLVNRMAMSFPRHVDRAELWNAGAYGLVEASRRYDPTTGTPFRHFATRRIQGAILDSTRSRDWVSRGARRRMRELRDGRERFVTRHGREPEATELADLLGVSVRHVQETQAETTQATLLHLDQHVGSADGEDLTLGDLLQEDDLAVLPEQDVERRELIGAVRLAIRHLPDIQREVVERSYFEGEQLREIAVSFDVTDARISQIRTEAMLAVRAYLAARFDEVTPIDRNAAGRRRRTAYLRSLEDVASRDFLAAAEDHHARAVLAAA